MCSVSCLCGTLQEHKCVLDSCRAIENEGFSVTYLPVQENGEIDLKVIVVCRKCSLAHVLPLTGTGVSNTPRYITGLHHGCQ